MHRLNESQGQTDGFDRLPDEILLIIFNQLSDIKALTRSRAVSKRFNSLVPHADNLLVKVDCVISTETTESFLLNILKSVIQSLQDLISPKRLSLQPRNRSSPSEILRGFEKIRRLELELPSGDLRLEKGTIVRWRAEFGRTLKSCVILAVQKVGEGMEEINGGDEEEICFNGGGLKLRVVWTISALIAASARHYLLREVIREHREIESLVLRDREGEGTVAMDKQGLEELRGGGGSREEGKAQVSTVGWKNRTTVPAVRMRMRHVANLELSGGVRMRGATLVVIRPTATAAAAAAGTGVDGVVEVDDEQQEQVEDRGLALGVFGGVFEEAVVALLKRPRYLLEMNSF